MLVFHLYVDCSSMYVGGGGGGGVCVNVCIYIWCVKDELGKFIIL